MATPVDDLLRLLRQPLDSRPVICNLYPRTAILRVPMLVRSSVVGLALQTKGLSLFQVLRRSN